MYYPTVEENNNTLNMIDTWKGYNHNYKISTGEFYDMKNLNSDYYPVLTPRAVRPKLAAGENIRGLCYASGSLVWLDGNVLHDSESNKTYDLTEYMQEANGIAEQQLIRFGAYILIFPECVYVNLYDSTDIGRWDENYKAPVDISIKYTMCTLDGSDYENITVSETAPENPSDGAYWLCTKEGSKGLNVWYASQSMWQPVATTYIRVEIPGGELTKHFKEGDTVTMDTSLTDVNDGSTIQKITDEYMVIIGILDALTVTDTTSSAWTLTIKRKVPTMSYICADKNRVWGCYYGYTDGEMVNEIYASKLGDFKNWYTYSGISTDSYAVTVGVPGQFTGCISYGGYPTFFKEDMIYKIYGDYPSEYTVITNNNRGVQQGSYRSLAVVGDYLFYKSPSDVVVYDGSSPTGISDNLGREVRYYAGVGGGCLDKYYIKLENAAGTNYYFVYDMTHGIWEKEDALAFEWFSGSENGQMFACTKDQIIGLGITDNYLYLTPLVGEEWVEWEATTGELGLEYADYKFVQRLTIRSWLAYTSEITISISYDGRPFEDVATLRGDADINSQTYSFAPYRCDHFKLKLNGHGNCRIYSVSFTFDVGSEEDDAYD